MSTCTFLAVLLCALVCAEAYRPRRPLPNRRPTPRFQPPARFQPPQFPQQQYNFPHYNHHQSVSELPAVNSTVEASTVSPSESESVTTEQPTEIASPVTEQPTEIASPVTEQPTEVPTAAK
ncbi:unnamed protein product [Candidula unifasciata]|uniref:Uncharacterized protein n=1 Tax=Candidula unifasciata TaxID=100452 RepID=A0A8S3ZDR9_9EUPU|nr:unnamed protein product [Candidula unifasciata]